MEDIKGLQIIPIEKLKKCSFNNLVFKEADTATKGDKDMKPKPPIFQDGSIRKKKYCLEYRFIYNKTQCSVYGKTKEECFQKRFDIMQGKKIVKCSLSFGKWLKEWHKLYDNKSENEKNIKQNDKYINDVINKIGHIPLTRLTGIDIQRFLMEYEKKKKHST